MMRTRSATDTVLLDEYIYGPRSLSYSESNTSNSFAAASKNASTSLIWQDTAVVGDVYKIQARVVSQRISGDAVEMTFPETGNGMLVFAGGGGEDVAVWAQEGDTSLIPNAKTGLWTGTQTELAAVTKVDSVIYFTVD